MPWRSASPRHLDAVDADRQGIFWRLPRGRSQQTHSTRSLTLGLRRARLPAVGSKRHARGPEVRRPHRRPEWRALSSRGEGRSGHRGSWPGKGLVRRRRLRAGNASRGLSGHAASLVRPRRKPPRGSDLARPLRRAHNLAGRQAGRRSGRRAQFRPQRHLDLRGVWKGPRATPDLRRFRRGAERRLEHRVGRWCCLHVAKQRGHFDSPQAHDGSGPEETCMSIPTPRTPVRSHPREPLALLEASSGAGLDLWLLPLEGERKGRPLVWTPASGSRGSFSADGRLIASLVRTRAPSQKYTKEMEGPGNRFQAHHRWWRSGPVERGRQGNLLRRFRWGAALPTHPEHVTARGRRTREAVQARHPQPLHLREPEASRPSPDGKRFRRCPGFPRRTSPGLRVMLNWNPPTGAKP